MGSSNLPALAFFKRHLLKDSLLRGNMPEGRENVRTKALTLQISLTKNNLQIFDDILVLILQAQVFAMGVTGDLFFVITKSL
jgi:hypothetical protein